MHGQSTPPVLNPRRHSVIATLKVLTLALTGLTALQSTNTVQAQNLDNEPLFGSISLEAGFSSTPFTLELSPGGEDEAQILGNDCSGYIRFAQPDFELSYLAGDNPLGVFALSDLDITMAINDPAGNWHCNDDSLHLSGTNSGIQFSAPLSGDYQIWVGNYETGAESIATMLAITEVDETQWAAISTGLENSVYAASFDLNGDIIFGDDSGGFANDSECDDPRFQGSGVAVGSGSAHLFKDATDCRNQFEAGMISLSEPEDMNLSGSMGTAQFGGNTDLFGTNSTATSPISIPDAGPFGEVMIALWQAFQAIPGDDAVPLPLPFGIGAADTSGYNRDEMIDLTGIDFGNNSGPYTNDGECDDSRFEGPGTAGFTMEEAQFIDAADCSNLYLEGLLTYVDSDSANTNIVVESSGLNFGDNSSMFANDGECDDPRFVGPGAASSNSQDDEMRDANDCRTMFESGRVTLVEQASNSPSISSRAAASTRTSQPAAAPPEAYIIGTPRGDVDGATLEDGSIYASGTVYGGPINPGDRSIISTRGTANYAPDTTLPVPDFGDNSSAWANDGECDDPRFEGEGMAFTSIDEDRGKDAEDCRAAFDAGTITLIRSEEP